MKKKAASLTFALLSSASLIGAVNPAPEVDEKQSRTEEHPVAAKPDNIYPAWDSQIADDYGQTSELLAGYQEDEYEGAHQESGDVIVSPVDPTVPSFLDGSHGSEQRSVDRVFNVDEGFDAEMRSYFRILGDLMSKDGEGTKSEG